MIEIYSKPNCAWCDRAKVLLDSRGINYREFKIGEDVTISWVRDNFPTMRTVPIITKDRQLVGGYDNLVEAVSNEGFGKTLLNG